MTEEIRNVASRMLQNKEVDAIFGQKRREGHFGPHLFRTVAELKDLDLQSRGRVSYTCRLPKRSILNIIQEKDSKIQIGVISRGCDERALIELAKRNQLDLKRIKVIGFACTEETAKECQCDRPYTSNLMAGKKIDVIIKHKDTDALLSKSIAERRAFWQQHLSKCIKCFGCRNACPMCFCQDCRMEQDLYLPTGTIPPASPMFQFIRFYHLSDKCIGCGECEKACPMGIPLLTISRLLKNDMKALFNYEAGLIVEHDSPLLLTLDEAPLAEDMPRDL